MQNIYQKDSSVKFVEWNINFCSLSLSLIRWTCCVDGQRRVAILTQSAGNFTGRDCSSSSSSSSVLKHISRHITL